jgi:hypothetical protein
VALVWLGRRWRTDARTLWLLAFGLPLPAYLLFSSLWIQVKINWFAPAYVPLVMALVVWWSEARPHWATGRPFRLARWSLLCVPLAMGLGPLLMRIVPPGKGSSWMGWDQVAARAEFWEDEVDVRDGIEGNVFFFAADYRDSAQLGHSLSRLWASEGEHHVVTSGPDGGEPTLAQNVLGQKALQFDHWTAPRSRIGQHAIFVLPRPEGREEMVQRATARFERIEKMERVHVASLGITLFDADIYTCYGYRGPGGPAPKDSEAGRHSR